MALHVAGHGVGPVSSGGPFGEDVRKPARVGGNHFVAEPLAEQRPEAVELRIVLRIAEPVVDRHPVAPVDDESGLAQACQVRRNAGLCQTRDTGQFGDRQFFGFQQGE
jgi:hypothetical protein